MNKTRYLLEKLTKKKNYWADEWCISELDLSKFVKQKFCYDYVKPKYDENAKHIWIWIWIYMDTDIFIIHVKTEDTYKEFAADN